MGVAAVEVSLRDLQSEVRALCADLGLEDELARGWMVGFSELALSALPHARARARLALSPVRAPGRVGIELSLGGELDSGCRRSDLGWWVDECEVRREGAGRLRLVARKWAALPADAA